MRLSECPRCGYESYEHLRSHSYCQECNYCPDLDWTRQPEQELSISSWAVDAFKAPASDTQENKNQILEGVS
jgi:uncharacterized OB-fold protein